MAPFCSHDRRFIDKIATHLMVFVQAGCAYALQGFKGNYEQYFQDCQAKENKKGKLTEEERLLLEYRLADVLSRLSVAKDQGEFERLDKEYHGLLTQIRCF
jgi:ATPase subunit of ABC transporter with duplicated ATPase domains